MNTCLNFVRRTIVGILWLALLFSVQPSASLHAQQSTPSTRSVQLPTTLIPPTQPPVPPAEIPEPITVILFGTGLAALSAVASRRRKSE